MQSPIKTKKYKMQIQKAVNKKLTTKASKSKGKAVEKQEHKRNFLKKGKIQTKEGLGTQAGTQWILEIQGTQGA